MKNKKICIVTPDIIGPINNGGIGTYVFNLSKILSPTNDIIILYTGLIIEGNQSLWEEFYSKLNIKFEKLEHYTTRFSDYTNNIYVNRSYSVFQYLIKNNFDIVMFQDWQANGFHTIQAKQTTNYFKDTLLTLTMHSNTEWINNGQKVWNPQPLIDTTIQWMERYCHKNCDILFSPSKHMFDWAEKRKWELNQNKVVIPYGFIQPDSNLKVENIDYKHLIFLGRLETRKGLELFCDSITYLIKKECISFDIISFIGKDGNVINGSSLNYLKEFSKLHEGTLSVVVKTELDTFQAYDYIKSSKGIVVIPSLLDNFPYTVIECIEGCIPFITSNTGGIPEMVSEKVLFDTNIRSLTEKIENLKSIDFINIKHKYSSKLANNKWLETITNLDIKPKCIKEPNAKVSICVAYYNYGKYLEQLFNSIEANDYTNYEVIVVNDGSTDKHSIEVFKKLKEKYSTKTNWHFYSQENSGIGTTRNFAASKATGEYLIFMDSDNCAFPNMIKTFVTGIEKSENDCLTSHFNGFDGHKAPNQSTKVRYRYAPYGNFLEGGIVKNVFGDANFIVKKSVFDKLSGFGTDRTTSWEDYEFLARLCLEGYKLDVIPFSIFWYRHTEAGFSRNTNFYKNFERVLNTYAKYLPDYMSFYIKSLSVPVLYTTPQNYELARIKNILDKYPRIRSIVKKIYIKLRNRLER